MSMKLYYLTLGSKANGRHECLGSNAEGKLRSRRGRFPVCDLGGVLCSFLFPDSKPDVTAHF
jgi:hypothetical protein